jgi:inorganic pyrophosphatase
MAATTFLQTVEKFEIEKYKTPKDIRSLSKTHIPYSGSPQKHPLNPDQIILVPDPYCSSSPYFEFSKPDITFVEKLASIVNMEGEAVTMVRIWVKKGSVAIQCTPFHVSAVQQFPC